MPLSFFQQFKDASNQFTEREVCNALLTWKVENAESLDEKQLEELDTEIIAFDFREREPYRERADPNYFRPVMSFIDANGQLVTKPSRSDVTQEVLDHWSRRAEVAGCPIFRFRYAALVWEFSKEVPGSSSDIRCARVLIDSAVKIANERLHPQEFATISKLEFALSVAQSIRDTERIQAMCQVIVDYETSIAELNKPGLWGFAYDFLVEDKRVQAPKALVAQIIADLEGKLEQIHAEPCQSFNPLAADAAALRLARYYRKCNEPEQVRRILAIYRAIYVQAAEITNALVGSAWLQRVYSILLQFGLKSEAELVAVKLRELGKKGRSELAQVSHDMEIPQDKFDAFLDGMVEGDIETALTRFTTHFLPVREQIERQAKELAEAYPLVSSFGTTLVDDDGRPKAKVGSLEYDLDGNIAKQTAQNMGFTAIFMRRSLERLTEKFQLTPENLLAFLYRSPIVPSESRPIVFRGLKAYFDGDWLVAMHVLIPQIEAILRRLIELGGGATWKTGRNNAFMLKNFEELLRDDRAVQSLGRDILHYLRVLFTDQRGWNLRNAVCHGIMSETTFCPSHADRVVHALLLFALIREGTDPAGQS